MPSIQSLIESSTHFSLSADICSASLSACSNQLAQAQGQLDAFGVEAQSPTAKLKIAEGFILQATNALNMARSSLNMYCVELSNK